MGWLDPGRIPGGAAGGRSRAVFESTSVADRWQGEQEAAFEALRECLIAAPVLKVADTRPDAGQFSVEMDASGDGVGAILQPCDGRDEVVYTLASFLAFV